MDRLWNSDHRLKPSYMQSRIYLLYRQAHIRFEINHIIQMTGLTTITIASPRHHFIRQTVQHVKRYRLPSKRWLTIKLDDVPSDSAAFLCFVYV